MPIFEFECQECGNKIDENVKWSEKMAELLDSCKCGKKNWKRNFTVAHSKNKDPDADPAVNQTNEMMYGKGWR
jgi:putative FmdB family regulatory protein